MVNAKFFKSFDENALSPNHSPNLIQDFNKMTKSSNYFTILHKY